jgi:hypothetical protein
LERKIFFSCIEKAKELKLEYDMQPFEYNTIFDPKSLEVIQNQDFLTKADEFSKYYQELFDKEGTIYKKGVFNPIKADASFTTLDKQGFFKGGHRVHLKNEHSSMDKAQLDKKIQDIHIKIDKDDKLKSIRQSLAKNAQTQALADLIENLSSDMTDLFLKKIKQENQLGFKQELWSYYVQQCDESNAYISEYESSKNKIEEIEKEAAEVAPRWKDAVDLFNERFVDMPFKLEVANQVEVSLGKRKASLNFVFEDAGDRIVRKRSEINTLSQGEKRALYLLNFIFEVEDRKLKSEKTLFIIDDIADSFDYKNKHAIIQYLKDICLTDNFYQIILTHNFDFYRSIAGEEGFVHRKRCLMANRDSNVITLEVADGINNIFIKKWKNNIANCEKIMCASIPFVRNLIEYTKGSDDPEYLKLTSMLHWKKDTKSVTVGNYINIYNKTFGYSFDEGSEDKLIKILFCNAKNICNQTVKEGLNLEDKVLLSIAIRLYSEIIMTNKIRELSNNSGYWCEKNVSGHS